MKVNPNINKTLSVKEAYQRLEKSVDRFIKLGEWYSPYAGYNLKMKAKINELRLPLVELKIAKKKNK